DLPVVLPGVADVRTLERGSKVAGDIARSGTGLVPRVHVQLPVLHVRWIHTGRVLWPDVEVLNHRRTSGTSTRARIVRPQHVIRGRTRRMRSVVPLAGEIEERRRVLNARARKLLRRQELDCP